MRMAALRSALFYSGWSVLTLLLGMAALPLLVSQRACWWAARRWVVASLAWLRIACRIESRIAGAPGALLVASNHQSTWDTLALYRALRNPAFVMKRELYWIPVFGWYLWRTGPIAIDRRRGREAMRTVIERAQQCMQQGRHVVLFPEGTRVPVGADYPYHSGIARLSAALAQPVAPAVVNAGHFWPKASWIKTPGVAVLQFLPTHAPCDDDKARWLAGLQAQIQQTLGPLAP